MSLTLLLRLEGALMSFGGFTIGKRRGTLPFPTTSALTGLIGNALGYDRSDAERLDALEDGLQVLSREERLLDDRDVAHPDLRVVDQQNVLVWKEDGTATSRTAGIFGRHGDDRHTMTLDKEVTYLTNLTFAVAVRSTHVPVEQIATALVAPARILYLGRKCCLPGAPLVEALTAEPPLDALRRRAGARALYRGPADFPDWPPDGLRRPFHAPTRRAHASGTYLDELLTEVELEPLP